MYRQRRALFVSVPAAIAALPMNGSAPMEDMLASVPPGTDSGRRPPPGTDSAASVTGARDFRCDDVLAPRSRVGQSPTVARNRSAGCSACMRTWPSSADTHAASPRCNDIDADFACTKTEPFVHNRICGPG
jgi:hypothetical protein